MLGDVYSCSPGQACALQCAELRPRTGHWRTSLLQGKWVIFVPGGERRMFTLLNYRPLIQEILAQGMESWLPPSLGSLPSSWMLLVHLQVGILNTAPMLPPAVRRYIFLKLWFIYGGVGDCIMSIYFTSCSHYTQSFLLSLSDHKHLRRLRSEPTTFVLLLFSLFTILSPKLAGLPHKNFPTKRKKFSWCPTGATSPFLCHVSTYL